ncbi:hypothetical protein G6F50_013230 [Rhizopus delemar]|uniref:Uncharacterized protein n=1 Tax=Rhizopus delemar TaxID=936053 RepID=A0A9P7CFW4_9FUNG|nr:hypothetical protein G6F50_013230 [Rhizopus delemar]
MSQLSPLLIELGTEELPVKALPGLAQAFFDGVVDGLRKRGVALELGDARPLSTPRRLARSAGPVPEHRAGRRRPADQGPAGLRRQGRDRLDRAGEDHRQQG